LIQWFADNEKLIHRALVHYYILCHMRFPLRYLFAVTAWVALAAFAGTISGQFLGVVLAVSFAAAAALALRDKRLAATIMAGLAGAIGMLSGNWGFAYVIPWPAWVGVDARAAVQQFISDHLAAFFVNWMASRFILGIMVAVATILGCMLCFRGRNDGHQKLVDF
jgi:hypothetical protein